MWNKRKFQDCLILNYNELLEFAFMLMLWLRALDACFSLKEIHLPSLEISVSFFISFILLWFKGIKSTYTLDLGILFSKLFHYTWAHTNLFVMIMKRWYITYNGHYFVKLIHAFESCVIKLEPCKLPKPWKYINL